MILHTSMRPTILAGMATVLGLLLASPCATVAQEASIQATVTVLAPQVQPSVRVVASGLEGTQGAAVVLDGVQSWGVRVHVGGDEFMVSQDATGGGRIELSEMAWASASQASPTRETAVRVVLAAN